MALIKCKECQKEISDKAVSCPYCGCPTGRSINTSVQLDPAPHKRRKYRIQSLIFTPMFIFGLIFGILCIVSGETVKMIIWFAIGFIGFIGSITSDVGLYLNKP